MPRTKKPAGQAVDPRNGRRADLTLAVVAGGRRADLTLAVVAGGKLDAPEGLSDESVALWDAYWADPVASVQTAVDRGVLLRWISEHDRYVRLIAEADRSPLVRGSQGQDVANPLYKIADRALAAAERCEKQLGIGALNRSSLGIAVMAERRSLADMNANYGGGHVGGDSTPAPSRSDPRVIEAAG